MDEMKIFAGRAHPQLARQIAEYLGMQLGRVTVDDFPDGETLVRLDEDVRGRDVFIIQPTCYPGAANLLELLIFVDCARRASADRVTAVLPYFGYARQDRKDEGRTPITAKLVANLITTAGADRVMTVDLHAAQVQGFFDVPLDNLYAEPILSRHFAEGRLENLVLLSPDVGNAKRAGQYARRLGGDLAIIHKRRISGSEAEAGRMIGDVDGKTVLMVDDMITTAGTICAAAEMARQRGATRILAGATHAVLCRPAIERLREAPIDEIVVTDTLPVPEETKQALPMMTVLTISQLIGEAIHRIHNNESVSSLFLTG
jgi:ribose-phosphate pyrophosphokinase